MLRKKLPISARRFSSLVYDQEGTHAGSPSGKYTLTAPPKSNDVAEIHERRFACPLARSYTHPRSASHGRHDHRRLKELSFFLRHPRPDLRQIAEIMVEKRYARGP